MIQNELKNLRHLSIAGLALAAYAEKIADGGKFELNSKR